MIAKNTHTPIPLTFPFFLQAAVFPLPVRERPYKYRRRTGRPTGALARTIPAHSTARTWLRLSAPRGSAPRAGRRLSQDEHRTVRVANHAFGD